MAGIIDFLDRFSIFSINAPSRLEPNVAFAKRFEIHLTYDKKISLKGRVCGVGNRASHHRVRSVSTFLSEPSRQQFVSIPLSRQSRTHRPTECARVVAAIESWHGIRSGRKLSLLQSRRRVGFLG